MIYSIQSGPITVSEENDHGDFYSLPSGTYVVRAYNPSGAGCFVDTSVTVGDTYVPFSFTLSVANVCVDGDPGTINVNVTEGSSTPLMVAYWQGSPSMPDASLTYESSFSKVVGTTGTWNVRVKDACGEAITQQITISDPYPSDLRVGGINAWTDESLSCTSDSIYAWIGLYSGSMYIDHTTLPTEGVYVDVYLDDDASCTVDSTNFVKTIHFVPSLSSLDFIIPKDQKLVFVTRTPCGESTTTCYDGDIYQAKHPWATIVQNGCATSTHPDGLVMLEFGVNDFPVLPITYSVVCSDPAYNSTGTMTTRYQNINDLPYGETYTITMTDACGDVLTVERSAPTPVSEGGTGLNITDVQQNISYCTSENGKITVTLLLDGYFVGLADYDGRIEAEIISGPDAGVVGFRYDSYRYVFSNITPGATNTVKFTNTVCGNEATLDFTTAMIDPFNQEISLEVEQLCDIEGKGNITINASYNNSTGTILYSLFKTGSSTALYTGSGSTFTLPNLDAGEYYAVMNVSFPSETGCSNYSLVSDTVTILPGGTAPVIIKKVSMVCEDEFGNPTFNGNASLEFIGAAPFLVEYKLASASSWITHEEESTGSELISGLIVDETYNIRITDQCGMIRTDNITVGTLSPLTIENEAQPCLGESYTVVVPTFANATYSWSKDGAPLPAYTTNSFTIPVFAETNTGAYQCVITIGTCVVRVVNFTLYSQLCDEPFGELSISGNVFNDGNGLSDGMVNGSGTNLSGLLYAVLTDASGAIIGSVAVNADGSYQFDNRLLHCDF